MNGETVRKILNSITAEDLGRINHNKAKGPDGIPLEEIKGARDHPRA